jgi:hypothetical protein
MALTLMQGARAAVVGRRGGVLGGNEKGEMSDCGPLRFVSGGQTTRLTERSAAAETPAAD